jgi:predicted Zn-dependent protease
MPDPIDALSQRWKQNPDAASTIALCEALRGISRPTLVQQVGEIATQKHSGQVPVLLAVARMYLTAQRLSDAQGVLVTAGKVAPRDGSVYRWLGEVLLRRGDAERAEKVLERATQLGSTDPDTSLWLERARVFKVVQAKAGARAVAMEIAAAAVQPPRRRDLASLDDEGTTEVRTAVDVDPEETGKFTKEPPTMPFPTPMGALRSELAYALLRAKNNVPDDLIAAAPAPVPAPAPAPVPTPAPAPARVPPPALPAARAKPNHQMTIDSPTVSLTPPLRPEAPPTPEPFAPHQVTARTAPTPEPFYPEETVTKTAVPPQKQGRVPTGPSSRRMVEAAGAAAAAPYRNEAPPGVPNAKDVLDALSHAGVFEPEGAMGAVFRWDRPTEKTRKRSSIVLGVAMTLVVGAGVGIFEYVTDLRKKQHEEAELILKTVEADILSSRASVLPDVETRLGHAFELDSRSPRAALDWLHERAMVGIVKSGTEVAFEDSMARAKEVEVPEASYAFARVAAFVFQGDTAGAAGLMAKWDGPAADDPWYQLMTGVTLERAGDPRAIERYAAAVKLAPDLVVAQVLLAQDTSLESDPAKAADLGKQFRSKYADRPEGSALVAMAWAKDPTRGEQAPPEVADMAAHAADLPLPLATVPHAVAALGAVDKHDVASAKGEIEKGLAVADGPGVAAWLGSIALETRDEALVQKAALSAVGFSAVYPPARVLAARVALLGARFDQALKATEDLDANSPDVAVVRAAAA